LRQAKRWLDEQTLEGKVTMAASGTTAPSTASLVKRPPPQLQIVGNGKDHPNAPLEDSSQTVIRHREISITNAFNFGSFRLLPAQRLLLKNNEVIPLGSRAMDILIALVERPSELVSKEQLMARVWPTTFVEPANLTVHISALRRTLGDGRDGNRFFINIPGRGYRFVAPITVSGKAEPARSHAVHNLPANVTRLSGRDDVTTELPLSPVSVDKGLAQLTESLLGPSDVHKVIAGLDKAVANSREAAEQAKAVQHDLAKLRQDLESERAKHEATLDQERAEHESVMARERAEVVAIKQAALELKAKAEADAAAAKWIKDDLMRRFKLVTVIRESASG
jgi:DNA-binding winged helix-turn-helix (wHTH) protein